MTNIEMAMIAYDGDGSKPYCDLVYMALKNLRKNTTKKTYSDNMDEPVKCAECGNIIKFGDGYASRKHTTENGFGYIVCEECYEKETDR